MSHLKNYLNIHSCLILFGAFNDINISIEPFLWLVLVLSVAVLHTEHTLSCFTSNTLAS